MRERVNEGETDFLYPIMNSRPNMTITILFIFLFLIWTSVFLEGNVVPLKGIKYPGGFSMEYPQGVGTVGIDFAGSQLKPHFYHPEPSPTTPIVFVDI